MSDRPKMDLAAFLQQFPNSDHFDDIEDHEPAPAEWWEVPTPFETWASGGTGVGTGVEPTAAYARGGSARTEIRDQIGDFTKAQQDNPPPPDDVIQKALDLIQDGPRLERADGGRVETTEEPAPKPVNDDVARLTRVVEKQSKLLEKLTEVLAAPQVVDRDETTHRVTRIRREIAPKRLN